MKEIEKVRFLIKHIFIFTYNKRRPDNYNSPMKASHGSLTMALSGLLRLYVNCFFIGSYSYVKHYISLFIKCQAYDTFIKLLAILLWKMESLVCSSWFLTLIENLLYSKMGFHFFSTFWLIYQRSKDNTKKAPRIVIPWPVKVSQLKALLVALWYRIR